MPTYFCVYCGRMTTHLNIQAAAAAAQVTRTTMYNWIRRALVHCVHRPSGRSFVCEPSLLVSEVFKGQAPASRGPFHTIQLHHLRPQRHR